MSHCCPKSNTITLASTTPLVEYTALSPWAQSQDGLTRACPVVVMHVVPPLRRHAFLFHFIFSFTFLSTMAVCMVL